MDEFDLTKYRALIDGRSIILNPPLEPAGLAHLEEVAQLKIPAHLVDMLEIGDGQSRHKGPPLFGGEFLQSSKDIAGWINWHHDEEQCKPSDCFSDCPLVQQGKMWRVEWIPITFGPGPVFLYFDCAPSPKGKYGQIILSSINTGKCGVVATDLNDLVAFSAEREESVTSWQLVHEAS
jgi:cell wall assembly regulator SMI1